MSDQHDTQPQIPIQQQPSGGGCGCWVGALVTLVIVALLVGAGLFLPPFNLYDRIFGESFVTLANPGEGAVVSDDSMRLSISEPAPGGDFGVQLSSVSLADFEAGAQAAGATLVNARSAVPPFLAVQSAVYEIDTRGTAPNSVIIRVTIPQEVTSADVLDMYGWFADAGTWRFIPAQVIGNQLVATTENIPDAVGIFQAAPLDPVVMVSVDVSQTLTSDVANLATIVAPAGLQPTLQGTITGSLAPGFDLNAGYRVMPVIRNFADPRALDVDTVIAILSNREARSNHAQQVQAVALGGNFDGIVIDYRGLPDDQRDNFSAFIQELGTGLRASGLRLAVVVPSAEIVPSPDGGGGVWDTGAYDWRAIGQYATYIQINLGINPQLYEPGEDRPIEAMLRWAIREVNRYQILISTTALSVREVGGDFTRIGFNEALSGVGDVRIVAEEVTDSGIILPGSVITASLDGMQAVSDVNDSIDAPYIEYQSDNGDTISRVWLTTGDALRFRMDRTVNFALGGVGFTDLLNTGVAEDVLEAIQSYKTQIPNAPVTVEFALRWRIEGANGVIDEVTTGLNEDLVLTVQAPDGNYAINVDIVGLRVPVARSGAPVAVFAPTNTPTPIPTSTPTPLPTVTPTPGEIILTAAPTEGQPGPPLGPSGVAPPRGGSITSGFEYGGHVTSTDSTRAVNAMRAAGMTWMKVQIRYFPGLSPGSVSGVIAAAHANGFRILLGVVGNASDLEAGGAGYVRDFANFLGGVAALGPDAIEVWNEPNIDREWPRNQISAAAYTDLLRQSYQAIKAANGSVMVISAAPAPTGAEAAFPGQVVNDYRFVEEMVAAGALQWTDCIGAHYNEGVVSPSAHSGDPRDNYYTRYFFGMLNNYWNLTGGQRPICFTELGYVSTDGYGALPAGFNGGQSVTLQQHAAYLAEAISLASQSGRVRLVIIWNVDFTEFSSDPQAGYAIIRRDGTCPACNAIAGAR